ncbi:MAG: ankyrin repeat domain-containing protein [Alphaproteobacteria bacterium]|nr:ankyrin repeat domain-containing protein [Alphaproteobacteria bacterium]
MPLKDIFSLKRKKEDTPQKLGQRLLDEITNLHGGDFSSCLDLIAKGADVNMQETYGHTPLIIATKKKNSEAFVRTLIKHGADIDAQNWEGLTALIFAVSKRRKEAANFLLEHGANPDIQKNNGWTALIYAAVAGADDIVTALLEHGADPDIQNSHGQTALMCAAKAGRNSTARTLMFYNASLDIKDKNGMTAQDLAKSNWHYPLATRIEEEARQRVIRNFMNAADKGTPQKRKIYRKANPLKKSF